MDAQMAADLVYGQEFCLPANANYYTYDCSGVSVPVEWYDQQAALGYDGQELHHLGLQTEGSQCMYLAAPNYGYAHSSFGYPVDPSFAVDGSVVGAQEYLADTSNPAYHQTVPSSYYAPVQSTGNGALVSAAQPLTYVNVPFVPSRPGQAVAATDYFPPSTAPVTSKKGVLFNPSVQSTIVSSKQFQDRPKLPTGQKHASVPLKQQMAGGDMAPAKLPHASQASEHLLHGVIPSVKHSPKANLSGNNCFGYVGSDLRKCVSAEKFEPSSKSSGHLNGASGGMHLLSEQNLSKAKKSVDWRSSAIIVKSYTSKISISNPDGKFMLRTDQYNRGDFRVEYPYARFFVIKSIGEEDVHKSVKYGVWSSSSNGNRKLDNAYKDAQRLAARNSSECPVFLFFSVNGSGYFCGAAEMVGPVDFQKDMDFWRQDKWTGSFPVRWQIIKDVPNHVLHHILLQNNENKPVTHSRDTQEVPYVPGTTMLKIFKEFRGKECLLDDFMKYEEAEARSKQRPRSKLSHNAPDFLPVSRRAHNVVHAQQPKTGSVPIYGTMETRDMTEKLQEANANKHQDSCPEAGRKLPNDSASDAPKANEQKESCYNAKPANQNDVKTVTNQQAASNGKVDADGKQQCWKKVEVPLSGKHPDTTANVSSKDPEKHPNGVQTTLVQVVRGTPETAPEEQVIIGKIGALAISSPKSEAVHSNCSVDIVTVGSMPVQIKKSK